MRQTKFLSYCANVNSCFETKPKSCDVAVIGGGIIGIAAARKIKQVHSDLNVIVCEKESALAGHQSSHNSGVIHSGVYYKPGSLKAQLCVKGANALEKYCSEKNIPCLKVGKLILALNNDQVTHLEILCQRAKENGIKDLHVLNSLNEIRAVCSECEGTKGIWIPNVRVVNFKEVAHSLAEEFEVSGGRKLLNFDATEIKSSGDCENPILVSSSNNQHILTKYLILCGGLQSEQLTKLVYKDDFEKQNQKFMTLRAEYLCLAKCVSGIHTNIYKVPNLNLPFLQAHISPQINKNILLGPWVVPSLTTDSYICSDLNLNYIKTLITASAFPKMIIRHLRECVAQAAKDVFSDFRIKEMQEMLPNMPYQHLQKYPVALQTQLLSTDGTFVDDFVFDVFEGLGIASRTINLKFTPSPAATCCLSIASLVQNEFSKKLCS